MLGMALFTIRNAILDFQSLIQGDPMAVIASSNQNSPGFNTIYITQPTFNACFHSLRSFFTLYIIWRLGVSDSEAIGIFSMFMALCYGTTVLGGYLANNGFGIKNGAVLGGVFSSLGLLCLFLPSKELCLVGMTLFCVGSGLFKPTLMTAVGLIFADPKDYRKTKTYSKIYALSNIGMVTLVPVCSFVGRTYGWPYSLFIVAMVMIAATVLLRKTMRFHPSCKMPAPTLSTAKCALVLGVLLLSVYTLFNYTQIFKYITPLCAFGSLIYLGSIVYQCNASERKGVLEIIGYLLAFSGFVALFEQSGSSLLLFINNAVNRDILGMDLPPSAATAFQPLVVLVCSVTLLPLVNRYEAKVSPIQGSLKIGYGFLFTTVGFFILAWGCNENPGTLVPLPWIAATLFFKTLGELWIAPIGLAKISQSAPPRFHGILMSFWTMAIAYGHYFGGIIAQFSIKPEHTPQGDFSHYEGFFASLGMMAFLIGLIVFAGRLIFPPILNRVFGRLATDA